MKRLITVSIVTTAVMIISGSVLDHYYKKYWWPFFDKFDTVMKDSAYYDGIYLGDSRVHFGINPYHIDSAAAVKTYNIGIGGATIHEISFLAQQYIKHHPAPKFAVISIGYSDLLTGNNYFENPCYYFFYTNDSFTNNTLSRAGYHTSLFRMMPVLKYTAFDDFNKFSIIEGIRGKTFLKEGGVVYNGFISNTTNSFNSQQLDNFVPADTAFASNIQTLENTIQLLAKHGTIPVLVYPPVSTNILKAKAPVEVKIDTAVAQLADRYKVPIWHFDNDTAFTPSMFSDQWHLNLQGSVLYSQKIGMQIKKLLRR